MKTRPSRYRKCFRLAMQFLLAASLLLPCRSGGATNSPGGSVELHIKAAYLFNFGRYIAWPQDTGDVVIGVVGHDPIVEILEQTVAGKTIKGRVYRIRVFGPTEPVGHCEILFVPRSEARHMQTLLASVGGKPVLTVSDQEGFANDGGMLEFLLLDDTLKFDINVGMAEKSGLKISSELLRVAHQIKGRHR